MKIIVIIMHKLNDIIEQETALLVVEEIGHNVMDLKEENNEEEDEN